MSEFQGVQLQVYPSRGKDRPARVEVSWGDDDRWGIAEFSGLHRDRAAGMFRWILESGIPDPETTIPALVSWATRALDMGGTTGDRELDAEGRAAIAKARGGGAAMRDDPMEGTCSHGYRPDEGELCVRCERDAPPHECPDCGRGLDDTEFGDHDELCDECYWASVAEEVRG